MKFILEIECDNAAFDGNLYTEVARILDDVAHKFNQGYTPVRIPLYDDNGRCVGACEFQEQA
jgi:hypothetical protein